MKKPVVLYVENKQSGMRSDQNHQCYALAYCLGAECACELILVDGRYDLERIVEKLKRLGCFLVAAIVAQERYDDDGHWECADWLRANIAGSFPVVVIADRLAEVPAEGDRERGIRVFSHHEDPALLNFVRECCRAWKVPDNLLDFRTETKAEQVLLFRQLAHTYRHHYLEPDDSTMLGVPDQNGQVVAQALRVNLLPIGCLKEEFDDALPGGEMALVDTPASRFAKDWQKLKEMDEAAREAVAETLSPAEQIGRGDSVYGFAIDSETLQSYSTNRFGLHGYAPEALRFRLEMIDSIRGIDREREGFFGQIFSGLLFTAVAGFHTPLLCLYDFEEELKSVACQRVLCHLIEKRLCLPIDHKANLLDVNF